MTRLLLVRHGESIWNAQRRWQGQADVPLSPVGEQQARVAATQLPDGYPRIVTSNLRRAARTGELLAEPQSLPVTVEPRLRERYAGPWEGLTRAEIEAGWPGMLEDGRRPDDYETDDDLLGRALDALADLADGTIAVTHGGVIRILEAHGGGPARSIPNLSARPVECDGDRIQLGTRLLLVGEGTVAAEAGGE